MGLYEDELKRQQAGMPPENSGVAPVITAPTGTLPKAVNPYQGGGQVVSSPYLNMYLQNQLKDSIATEGNSARNRGRKHGLETFYEDPDMMATRDRLQDLSQGYDGKELGALRAESKANIAGNANAAQTKLSGQLARSGTGGARAAAISAAANKGFNQNIAADERKATIDNAQIKRAGTKDATDFLMRQKYGVLADEQSEKELEANALATQAAAEANKKKKGGIGGLMDSPEKLTNPFSIASEIGGGGCFITTAACKYLGYEDNCDFLNTFRSFRDEHMGGKNSKDLIEYYTIAPQIVEKIGDDDGTYRFLLGSWLNPAFEAIKMKDHDRAQELYSEMVMWLKAKYEVQ